MYSFTYLYVTGDVVIHKFSQLIEVIFVIMQLIRAKICAFVVHFEVIEWTIILKIKNKKNPYVVYANSKSFPEIWGSRKNIHAVFSFRNLKIGKLKVYQNSQMVGPLRKCLSSFRSSTLSYTMALRQKNYDTEMLIQYILVYILY